MYYLQKELYNLIQQDSSIFDFLQEAALDGLWYWDLKNPEEEWMNNRFWEVLGYKPEEQAHSPKAWQGIIHPEDAAEALKQAQAHFENPESKYNQVLRYRHKEGHTVWIRCRGLAIRDDSGRPIRMLGAHIDITKEKEAELRSEQLSRRFQSILDNQDIFVVRIRPNGEHTYINAHYKRVFGNSGSFFDKIISSDRANFQTILDNCLEQSNQSQTIKLLCITKNKEPLHIKWELVSLQGEKKGELEVQCMGIDFTDIQHAQEELEYTKKLLTRASRGAKIGAWEVNLLDNTILWSEVTKEIHEVPADYKSTVETGVEFYKEGIHRERIKDLAHSLIETGQPFKEDLLIVTAKGREVWVRVIGQAIIKEGKCERVYGTLQDIDTQKRDAIEKKRWRKAIEQNQDEIYLFHGLHLNLVYANEQAKAKHSKAQTKLEERSLFEFTGSYPKEEIHTMLRALMQEQQRKTSFETTFLDAEQRRYPVEIELQWLKDAEVSVYLLTARDISERKASENRRQLLQSVVKNTQEGVLIAEATDDLQPSSSLQVVYVNPAFEQIVEMPSALLYKKGLESLQGPQTSKLSLNQLRSHIRNREAFSLDLIIYKASAVPIWVQISAKPILNEKGALSHWIGVMRDISEQKDYERLLLKARNAADAATKAKSSFLANMSHEIRTPLNGIVGFSSLLKDTPLNELQQQYLSTINESADNLIEIINDILDFSKIEAGKLELESQKVNLTELLRKILEIVKLQAHQKGLELLLDISADTPTYVWVDALRLKQVLLNLLSNAIKFTEKGEVELTVRPNGKRLPTELNLYFSVRDTGQGISLDKQSAIFEAFNQADVSISRQHGGTGLGLSISQGLLEIMGGKLQLKSRLKQGSIFYFNLQLKTEQTEKTAPPPPPIKRVLLLEPNLRNCAILRERLSEIGIKLMCFHNASEVLDFLRKDTALDALVLNYNLAETNGLEVAKTIREELQLTASSHPIILLHSAVENEAARKAYEEIDIQQCLLKPVYADSLLNTFTKIRSSAYLPDEENPDQSVLSLNPFRILVAEDHKINALLVEKMLGKLLPKAELKIVQNGQEALQAALDQDFELVLMDIHMPVMDGLRASREIRKRRGQQPPIIALTAETLRNIQGKVREAGMDDYLSKPFEKQALKAILQEYLPVDEKGKNLPS